ncbi:MAG: hypothetical protein GY797_16515 [Deltaproteobacteria bacterium]|nr:hypothetical protein [Deltaproteobacteria bacterium]
MKSKEIAIILMLINVLPMLIVGYWLFVKKDLKTYTIPLIATAFCFATSCLMLIHMLIFPNYSFVRYFPPLQMLITGISLNTVYIITWLVGFFLVWTKNKKKLQRIAKYNRMKNGVLDDLLVYDWIQRNYMYFFLLLAIASKIYFLIKTPYYGWAQSVYASSDFEALGEFSLLAAFSNFLHPLIIALLFFDGTKKGNVYKLFQLSLWTLFSITILADVIVKQQRGRFFLPLLLVAIALAFQGERKKFSLLFIISVVGLILLSPIMDAFRRGKEKGTLGKFIELSRSEYEATSVSDSKIEKISYGFAKHAQGGLTSGILYHVAQREGFVGLSPYLSIPYAIIPTILLREKHYPGSADGTFYTAPNAIAGSILRNPGVTVHVHGGGVSYWQLGWIGVVLNGFLVGMFFAKFQFLILSKKNFFLWIIFFRMIGYGQYLNMSLDFVLYHVVKKTYVLLPIIIFYYIVIRTPSNKTVKNGSKTSLSSSYYSHDHQK